MSNLLFLIAKNKVFTYIIDFGKEHGLTALLNPVLADPDIKEKFTVNFKQLSWNNYKYKYSLLRDGAIEVDMSVIYTSKTFIPRSINYNITIHMHGLSVNFMDATIRIEGMDDMLKAIVIDKLMSKELVAKLMEKPEALISILNEFTKKVSCA